MNRNDFVLYVPGQLAGARIARIVEPGFDTVEIEIRDSFTHQWNVIQVSSSDIRIPTQNEIQQLLQFYADKIKYLAGFIGENS